MVYILIVNYNSSDDTIHCLNSIKLSTYLDYRIVVVDNSPTEEYIYSIYNHFREESVIVYENNISQASSKQIILIKARENNGFAAANNVGLRFIYGCGNFAYVWLLNNDTEIEPNTLLHLVEYAKSDPLIAICGSKLIEFYDRSLVQEVAGIYNKYLAKVTFVGKRINVQQQIQINRIDYVPGASMFVNRVFWDSFPYLCEDYFLYFEELDMAYKVRSLGMKLDVCMNAVVYHKGGATISSGEKCTLSNTAEYFQSKNRLLFTYKYHKHFIILVLCTYLYVLFHRLIRHEYQKIPVICRGVLDAFIDIHNKKIS